MRTEIRLSKKALGNDVFALLLEYAELQGQSPVATLTNYLIAHQEELRADYQQCLNEYADRKGIDVDTALANVRAQLFQTDAKDQPKIAA